MAAKFEVVADEQGRFVFTLKDDDGSDLLSGLRCDGRITVLNDIMHVRKAVRRAEHFVVHDAPDGAFAVLKDHDGEVLGRSPHVPKEVLARLVGRIQQAAVGAPILERRSRPKQTAH